MFRRMFSKYHNKKKDGFDSVAEKSFEQMLQRDYPDGVIQRQVKIEVIPKTDLFRPVYYFVDYLVTLPGKAFYFDVKGYRTREFRLKQKMLYYTKGINIIMVKMNYDRKKKAYTSYEIVDPYGRKRHVKTRPK